MPQLIPTAQRTFQVFEAFARERRPLTNSELARFLDLADSSCSDLLFTLREAGYLLRTPKSRLFYPTTRLQDIAQRIAATDTLQAFAAEALEMLSKRTGETSMCGHLEGSKVKIFACQESSRALRYVLQPGTVVDVHATALGKAILGAMPMAARDALIDVLEMTPVTAATIRDRRTLKRQVTQGIARHWFMARNEGGEGVMALAIAGLVDDRVTALSVVGPTQRLEQNLDDYVRVLVEARKEFF
jgi:DNA-binding IclR family transcriptional regulator